MVNQQWVGNGKLMLIAWPVRADGCILKFVEEMALENQVGKSCDPLWLWSPCERVCSAMRKLPLLLDLDDKLLIWILPRFVLMQVKIVKGLSWDLGVTFRRHPRQFPST